MKKNLPLHSTPKKVDKPSFAPRTLRQGGLVKALGLALFLVGAPVFADSVVEDIGFARLSGDRVQINLVMSGDGVEPTVFRTIDPPRLAFDFVSTKNKSEINRQKVNIAAVNDFVVVNNDQRMRMILNLNQPVNYSINPTADGLALIFGSDASLRSAPAVATPAVANAADTATTTEVVPRRVTEQPQVNNIDFRRTNGGGGRIVITVSDSNATVNINEVGGEIIAELANTSIDGDLEQRLDVVDFATPVSFIDTYQDGNGVKMVITPNGRYKQSSIQTGDQILIDLVPLSERELIAERTDEFGYSGERLSLNFQRISVRAALQVIADFTGFNFVTSDSVTGDLSLRLKDVPWDQALDVILQSKGLSKRQRGNVIWVAPSEEIAAKERQALEAAKEVDELEPLVSELIPISYAKAEDVADILKSVISVDANINGISGANANQVQFNQPAANTSTTSTNSLLSERGSVSVDERTNSLLIQDTAGKLREIQALIKKLDIPVRQVQIEARIVQANEDFSRNIGARLGFTSITEKANVLGANNVGDVFASGSIDANDAFRTTGAASLDDSLSVNLPAGAISSDPAASYGFSLAKIGSGYINLIDLEISALQAEGNGKVLANPKILTTDKQEATIEQGQERLTTFGSAFGTAATQGQRAVLSLTVTPQITPDNRITLDVDITNDSFVAANTNTVNTKRISTQALLENGETVVIGGIYTQEQFNNVSKVPLLGDIPWLGNLFKKRTRQNNRDETLVFLTPRIVDSSLTIE